MSDPMPRTINAKDTAHFDATIAVGRYEHEDGYVGIDIDDIRNRGGTWAVNPDNARALAWELLKWAEAVGGKAPPVGLREPEPRWIPDAAETDR